MKNETRMVGQSTVDSGKLIMPKTIDEQILEIAKQGSSVASLVNIFTADTFTKFLVDLDNQPAFIYAEGESATTNDPTLAEISLDQKRMATAIEISRNALLYSAVPFEKQVLQILANRVLLGIEYQMFNMGNKDGTGKALQGIFVYNNYANRIEDIKTITGAGVGVLAYKDLLEAYVKFAEQPENLNGAVWVVEDISKISGLKDDAQRSILTFDNLPAGAIGRVFGIPVYKTKAFNPVQKVGAVLINPKRAYAVSISKKHEVQKIEGDTIQELKGASVFLGEVYLDGKVVNPRAITIVKTA